MILTLMSGSLALAGCGGGSDSLPFEDTPPIVVPQEPVPPGSGDPVVPAPEEEGDEEAPGTTEPGDVGPVIPPVVEEPTQPGAPDEPGSPSQPSEPEAPTPPVTEPETPVPPQQPDPDPSDEPTVPEEPGIPEEPGTPSEPEPTLPEEPLPEEPLPEEPLPPEEPPVVTPPVERNMSLSWRAPTARENGDPLPLSQLQGYRIYYGPQDNPTAFKVDVKDASQTAYTLKDLAKGTYRVAVSAIDKNGAESELSNTMTKVIN